MGTPGNDVVDRLQAALNTWSAAHNHKAVKVIRKVLRPSLVTLLIVNLHRQLSFLSSFSRPATLCYSIGCGLYSDYPLRCPR
jgi:hypothetical protein